jgi:hypothetical protein
MVPVFRLFVDEVGHGSMKFSDHPNERYLSLTGIIMPIANEAGKFANDLNALKANVFGNTDIILHRTEIVRKEPPFDCLTDTARCAQFDSAILTLLRDSAYRVITVVIDKKEHKSRYRVWQAYPYHYCLMALMERYVMLLQGIGSSGHVMAESRGEKDNRTLQDSYARLYSKGTDWVGFRLFQESLTTRELKIRDKRANIPGLQLADLIANPSMWSLICERTETQMNSPFGTQVVEILRRFKYRRKFNGQIAGIGTKWLP